MTQLAPKVNKLARSTPRAWLIKRLQYQHVLLKRFYW